MGISNEKFEKYLIDKNEIKITEKPHKNIQSNIKNRERNNNTQINQNPYLENEIQTKIEFNNINNQFNNIENDKENISNNINLNYKNNSEKNKNNDKLKVRSLSYEKFEKIQELPKNINQGEFYNNLYENNLCSKSNPEIESKSLSNYHNENEREELYGETDENNSFSENSNDNEYNNNSEGYKDLQIIDENIKTLFLNSGKSTKDNSLNSSINTNEEKNSSFLQNQESNLTKTSIITDYELNFYRNGNDIRRSYIQKLVSKALFLPNNKPKTHNSLIIFDWDDTLLPTTFLTPFGIYDENIILTEIEQKKIERLEKSVVKLLNIAISKGDVYIITNAGLGWVEYSAKKFYPNVLEILGKIKIISARGEWEKDYPGDSRSWKIQTFLSLQNKLDVKLVTNIICLGDSLFEMEAGRILATKFSEAFVKTIKFKEGPKPEELNQQLILVTNQFNSIYSAVKNLTIRVEKKKKK